MLFLEKKTKKLKLVKVNVIQKKLDLLQSWAFVNEIVSLCSLSKFMKSMMTVENYVLL